MSTLRNGQASGNGGGAPGKSAAQRLEDLRERHKSLSERRTRVEVEVQAASRQLEEAQQEAMEEFGIRDLEGLRTVYKEREQSNESLLQKFAQELDTVEQQLTEAERQLAN